MRRPRWLDLPYLGRIRQRVLFDQPTSGWSLADPVRASFRDLLPFPRTRDRILVARTERGPVGYILFASTGPDQRWHLRGIGANLGVYEAEELWDELLRHGVIAAGLEGVKRLYARIPERSPALGAVRRVGFAPYTQEHVLAAPVVPMVSPGTRARQQTPSDVWSIHQLYMATVPKAVQVAEALTSHHWDVQDRSSGSLGCTGWIVDDGYQAIAYARVDSRPDAHVLEVMHHPDHLDAAEDAILTACAELSRSATRRAFAVVRGYQAESLAIFTRLGFVDHMTQDLHVKYTTASARTAVGTVVAFSSELKEPVAKRVPTFLKGPKSDPTSEQVS